MTADDAWAHRDGMAGALLTRRLALEWGNLPPPRRPPVVPPSFRSTAPSRRRRGSRRTRPPPKPSPGSSVGQTVKLRGATFTFGPSANNYAVLTLTATDAKPLAHSHRLLLTLLDRVQNTGQSWDADHKKLAVWGHGPTVADGILATVTLKADGPRRVYALDATGGRAREVPAAFGNGVVTFAAGSG